MVTGCQGVDFPYMVGCVVTDYAGECGVLGFQLRIL